MSAQRRHVSCLVRVYEDRLASVWVRPAILQSGTRRAPWPCVCLGLFGLSKTDWRPCLFVPHPCGWGVGLRLGHVFALVCSACRKPIGVRACSSRIPAGRWLSLARPRESHQREGRPSQRRLARLVRARSAVDGRLRPQHIPVLTAQCARSIARTLRAFRPSPAVAEGDWRQRAPARPGVCCGIRSDLGPASCALPWQYPTIEPAVMSSGSRR